MGKVRMADQRQIERQLLSRMPEEALQAFQAQERSARDVAKEYGSRESYDWHQAAFVMVRGILEERERPLPCVVRDMPSVDAPTCPGCGASVGQDDEVCVPCLRADMAGDDVLASQRYSAE